MRRSIATVALLALGAAVAPAVAAEKGPRFESLSGSLLDPALGITHRFRLVDGGTFTDVEITALDTDPNSPSFGATVVSCNVENQRPPFSDLNDGLGVIEIEGNPGQRTPAARATPLLFELIEDGTIPCVADNPPLHVPTSLAIECLNRAFDDANTAEENERLFDGRSTTIVDGTVTREASKFTTAFANCSIELDGATVETTDADMLVSQDTR